jgi:hypothetical protein
MCVAAIVMIVVHAWNDPAIAFKHRISHDDWFLCMAGKHPSLFNHLGCGVLDKN